MRALVVLSIAMIVSACGQTSREPVIVSDVWANATPAGATVAGVYLRVEANAADTLLAATTTVADHVEMHTSGEENGMMRMRPLASVPLAPGQKFDFAPGGAHFMLMGLRQPLPAGLRFPMNLEFQHAGTLTVQVQVIEPGTR